MTARQNLVRLIGYQVLLALLLSACLPTPLQGYIPLTATVLPSETPDVTALLTPTTQLMPTTSTGTTVPMPTVFPKNTPVGLDGTQVQLWYSWSGNTEINLRALIEEFNARNEWSIKVTATGFGGSDELSQQMGSSPFHPDIVVAFPEQALEWQAKSSLLVDLKDYIYDPVFGYKAGDLVDYPSLFWEQGQFDGKQLGLPAPQTLLFLLYNVSWAKDLGFSHPPSTPDEFRQQSCAAAKANQYSSDTARRGTGGWLIDSGALPMFAWTAAFGGSLGPDLKDSYHFYTSQSKAAFSYLSDLYSNGCAWKGRNPDPYDYFAQRYALFVTVSMEELQDQAAAMTRAKNADEWMVLPFPSSIVKPFVLNFGTSYYLLSSKPAEQTAAWLFMRWISMPEQESRLVKGSGMYPTRASSITLLEDYRSNHPQWAAALNLLADALPVPRQPSWQTAREIVQDAAWQLFQTDTKASQVTQILEQMDSLFAEVIQKKP